MRTIVVASLLAALYPAVAVAQTPAAPYQSSPAATAPAPATAMPGARGGRGGGTGDVTRDQFIEQAVDRARRRAAARFDQMDVNHKGVLTAEEIRASRSQRHGGGTRSQ
jgi:hypothetical protein